METETPTFDELIERLFAHFTDDELRDIAAALGENAKGIVDQDMVDRMIDEME